MTQPWLYNIEPELAGAENMRRDEAMTRACMADGISRLRLYSWKPFTLSLGHNQDEGQIDAMELERRGYEMVRRPTGGRAVLHAEELTYAVAMPSDGQGVHATYERISVALMRGLERLGAREIEFSRSQPDFRGHYESDESASCFSASALNELMWQGRKLVGSAQRRYGDVLLQHGSLLIGDAHLEIIDLLRASSDADRRATLKGRLAGRTATLRDMLPTPLPSFTIVAEAICYGFGETFQVELRRVDDLTLPTLSAETLLSQS